MNGLLRGYHQHKFHKYTAPGLVYALAKGKTRGKLRAKPDLFLRFPDYSSILHAKKCIQLVLTSEPATARCLG